MDLKEPSLDECVDILKGLQPHYEKHHNVRYSSSSLRAAVELSARHVQDRLLPDKAIDVMDEAGASVRLRPGFKSGSSVSRQDVERIVARMAGIPARTVSGKERDRLKTLKDDLGSVLFGQDEAVDIVTRAILRSRAGLGQDGSSRRFVPLLWTHRGRQDGTRQAACRAHGRRLPAFRHERVHGKTCRIAAYRRASRLRGF